MSHPIEGLMEAAISNIKGMADVETVIGEPVTAPDGTILVPVSSVAFGFGVGGSEFGAKSGTQVKEPMFGGGCGGGATVKPMGFLVISNGSVRFIPMSEGASPVDKIIDMIPGMIDKVNGVITSARGKKKDTDEIPE